MIASSLAIGRASPRWLDRTLYPFETRAFETGEGRVSYIDEGRGRRVLIAHGTPTWSFEWRTVIGALAPTHRVIVPDHLGFGLSDEPGDPSILRPADHARRFMALADALDLRDAILVVHDFGGPIGLPLALERPTRVGAIVAINTWAWAHADDRRVARLSRFIASPLCRFLYCALNASPRWLLAAALGDRRALTRAVHRHYLAPLDGWRARTGA